MQPPHASSRAARGALTSGAASRGKLARAIRPIRSTPGTMISNQRALVCVSAHSSMIARRSVRLPVRSPRGRKCDTKLQGVSRPGDLRLVIPASSFVRETSVFSPSNLQIRGKFKHRPQERNFPSRAWISARERSFNPDRCGNASLPSMSSLSLSLSSPSMRCRAIAGISLFLATLAILHFDVQFRYPRSSRQIATSCIITESLAGDKLGELPEAARRRRADFLAGSIDAARSAESEASL